MSAKSGEVHLSGGNVDKDLVDRLIEDWARERPELDARAMSGVGRIMRVGHMLGLRINRLIKPFRITYTDLDLLATLRRSGEPFTLTPEQLRQSVLLTSGAMTAAIDRLEKKGHIKRRQDSKDRRVRRISLSAQGRALIDEVIELRFKEAEDALSALTQSERERLYGLLRKLAGSLGS